MDKGLEKNITIADVAEALGVSKTTVSRAISGKGRIGRETRERVLAYIEEHDYKPNVIAKGLAQSKTYNICVVMPGEYDVVDLTFFQECLFGIQGEMAYYSGTGYLSQQAVPPFPLCRSFFSYHGQSALPQDFSHKSCLIADHFCLAEFFLQNFPFCLLF